MLCNKIITEYIDSKIFSELENHMLESPANHIYFLIKSVCMKYINIRLHFMTKIQSEKLNPIRNQLTKLILFKGQ